MRRRPAVVPELCGSEQGFAWWRSADGPCLILLGAHRTAVGWRANVAVGRAGSSHASPFQLLLQQLWGSKQCRSGLRAELCDFLGVWILPFYHAASDWVLPACKAAPCQRPSAVLLYGVHGAGRSREQECDEFCFPQLFLFFAFNYTSSMALKKINLVYAQSTATSFLNEALPFLICLLAASLCNQAFATAWLC